MTKEPTICHNIGISVISPEVFNWNSSPKKNKSSKSKIVDALKYHYDSTENDTFSFFWVNYSLKCT